MVYHALNVFSINKTSMIRDFNAIIVENLSMNNCDIFVFNGTDG